MFLTDAQKSTEINCRCESLCEKNVQILIIISVLEFRPAHRNFRPAPSNPRKKMITHTRAFYSRPASNSLSPGKPLNVFLITQF